jgi:hypothetical protein
MSELEQLKTRIKDSGPEGVETAHIRDDYEPAGDMMIAGLIDSGEFITRRAPAHSFDSKWRIFISGMEPY